MAHALAKRPMPSFAECPSRMLHLFPLNSPGASSIVFPLPGQVEAMAERLTIVVHSMVGVAEGSKFEIQRPACLMPRLQASCVMDPSDMEVKN
jgi:hypothetical protein